MKPPVNISISASQHNDMNLSSAEKNESTSRKSPEEVKTVTKAEIAEMLYERVGLNKREAKEMVNSFFGHIIESLERGEEVKLSGFGNFTLRTKPERPGRNPRTGVEIPITARRVVSFHASQKLKEIVDSASNK
jgi:integration host factor, alpha subunit